MSEPRYYQAVFATRHGLSATDAKAIADFILGRLTEDNDPAVIVAQVHPLAAAPINFPDLPKPSGERPNRHDPAAR